VKHLRNKHISQDVVPHKGSIHNLPTCGERARVVLHDEEALNFHQKHGLPRLMKKFAPPVLYDPTPIELTLGRALARHSGDLSWPDVGTLDELVAFTPIRAKKGFTIPPVWAAHQVVVPRMCGRHYRVDFLFAAKTNAIKPVLFAVECDGHDFHEKTKDQAARDKQRDRELLGLGVTVLRYTGSEIHANARHCAFQAITLTYNRYFLETSGYDQAAALGRVV
jgi:hypothetical protein